MTLKEELTAKKEALAELKDRIEAGEAEAIEEGVKLQGEIEAKQAEIETAEKKAALLNVIGKKEDEVMEEKTGLKAMELASLKSERGSRSTYIKAASDNEVTTQIQTYSQSVAGIQGDLSVRRLFSQEAISGNALTFYRLGALEGTIAQTTAEGATKSRIHIPYTPVTVALNKIGAYFKETDELLTDAAFLESAIRTRGIFEFNKAVEAYLVATLKGTSGVQTGGAAISFDSILAAKQDIFADTGYQPDAMIINPADWATLLQSKDSNLQYLLGGPAYGSYGNGSYAPNPRIWGLEVVESAAMTAGQVIVGAFRAAASVVTKAGEGLRVEVSNSNEDDFINNRVTVRIEERLVEAVRIPAAFEIVGTAS